MPSIVLTPPCSHLPSCPEWYWQPPAPERLMRPRTPRGPRTQSLVRVASIQSATSITTPDNQEVWQLSARAKPRQCRVHDRHAQLVPYHEAWQWQKDQVNLMTSSSSDPTTKTDQVIILQHPPVYTLGTGSTADNLLFDQGASGGGVQVVRTERGGEVTYHGPGQLVMYPLLDLTHHTQDLHWYMRGLEEVVIRALWEVSGIRGVRVPGLTGVWVDGAKVAALGVRAKRWVTYHGLALNVCPDLAPFRYIVPCGIADKPVTSVEQILSGGQILSGASHPPQRAMPAHSGTGQSPEHERAVQGLDVGSGADRAMQAVLAQAAVPRDSEAQRRLLDEYSFALLDAFAEVFSLELLTE